MITEYNIGDFEYERKMEDRLIERAEMMDELYMEEEMEFEEPDQDWCDAQIEISKSLRKVV
jgi:hypothetical protein